jgi:hypothetical protein
MIGYTKHRLKYASVWTKRLAGSSLYKDKVVQSDDVQIERKVEDDGETEGKEKVG